MYTTRRMLFVRRDINWVEQQTMASYDNPTLYKALPDPVESFPKGARQCGAINDPFQLKTITRTAILLESMESPRMMCT